MGDSVDNYLLTRLGVKELGSAKYFLFRGSPDIVNRHSLSDVTTLWRCRVPESLRVIPYQIVLVLLSYVMNAERERTRNAYTPRQKVIHNPRQVQVLSLQKNSCRLKPAPILLSLQKAGAGCSCFFAGSA